MAETKISVRSDLLKIVDDLKIIGRTATETSESLGAASKELGKKVNDQLAILSGGMNKIQKMGSELSKNLVNDFKGLFAVNALAGGLKLSEQFSGTIKQAVALNDTVRNLAPIFGMTEARAETFKRNLVKNLGEIGLGSDAAANALMGLSETPVRGERALEAYAKTASELASISKQKGQEGGIAKGLSGVVVAQGGDPNDPQAMQKVAEDIVRIRNATGRTATEALDTLTKLFSSANTDFKKRLAQGGGVSLASAGLIGGQGSTDFLQRYMGLSSQQRAGYDAQGLGRLVGQDGQLDTGAFQSTVGEAKRRGSGNAEFGLTTMGMSQDEAKGFLRLAEALRTNGEAVEKARTSQVDLQREYRETMTMGDAFRANLNRQKGAFASLMETIGAPDLINKFTNTLQATSESGAGSAAVVGGSALLAAFLTSKGLGAVGGLISGEAKKAGIEGLTGEKVQRVEVINWPSSMSGLGAEAASVATGVNNWKNWGSGTIAAGAGVAGETAGAVGGAGLAGTAGLGIAAAGVGLTAAAGANYIANGGLEQGISDLVEMFRDWKNGPQKKGSIFDEPERAVAVTVTTKDRSLKAFPSGPRGARQ